jgi:tetratricopeptide (TPR) repeat protein
VNSYFAIVFCDLQRHSTAWSRVPRAAMVAIIAEYRYLAQSIASQYGSRHENFAGDGHLFLFDSADAAVHFGLKLITFWKNRRRHLSSAYDAPDLPLRVGCHFGECTELEDPGAWIGRAVNLAKQVEDSAAPDAMFVTESVIDLIDLPFYEFAAAGTHTLKGDHLPRRLLYRLLSVDQAALAARPVEELTAGDWFLRGGTLVGGPRENTEEEAECYRQALRLRPNYPEAHNNLGVLLKAQGKPEEAAQHYEEAIRQWPRYSEAHYNYAILREALGDAAAALDHYREAVRGRPDYIDAHHRLAGLLASLGQGEEAERHYREALRLRPGYAEAHNNYAILLDQRGAAAEAERHYREALRLRPDYAEAHYNYALLLEGAGCAEEAAEHYRAALRILPDYAEAHNNLAALLYDKGDLAGAETHYAAALRLRPDDPETNYNFALLAQAKGDAATAEKHFRLASELAGDNAHSRSAIEHPA